MYRIKQLREEQGISQRLLAHKIGASPKAVSFWETGKVEPSAKYICGLSDVFEVSCDYLLGREDDFGTVNVMRELSEQEKSWLHLFSHLSQKNRAEATEFLEFLISRQ